MLLLVGLCAAGAVVQVAGAPGITVWAGVLAAEALVLLVDRRLSRRSAGEPAGPAYGERAPVSPTPASPASSGLPPPPPPAPREPPAQPRRQPEPPPSPPEQDMERAAAESRTRVSAMAPPDAGRRWLAEIAWREEDDSGRFVAFARGAGGDPVAVAESRSVAWPPVGADAVAELSRAVDELDAALLGAGWVPAERGPAWYARRFAWGEDRPSRQRPRHTTERRPRPHPRTRARAVEVRSAKDVAPAGDGGEPSPATERSVEWPAGSERLHRCEVRWTNRYGTSRLEAVVHRPRTKATRSIGASQAFKWTLKDPPSSAEPAHLDALERLCAALRHDGWEEVEAGTDWYARRFVWRHDTPPPGRVRTG